MIWEELEALAAHNVQVNAWLQLMRAERLTREEMLIGLAIHLAKANDRMMAMAVELQERTARPVVLITRQRRRHDPIQSEQPRTSR